MRKLIGIRREDIPPTFTKEELDEMGAKIDKANDQAHYALNRVRDNNSPTGYATKVVGGKKNETQASKKAGYEAEYPEDAVTNNQTTDANGGTNTDAGGVNTNAGTNVGNGGGNNDGGNVTSGTTTTPNGTTTTPNGTTTTTTPGGTNTTTTNTGNTNNGGNGTQTAPTDEEILKLQKWIDDSYNKRKQENEDDQRRARRNLLLSSIADGLNAMHRAYTHSRGINAMPGSERIMSEKYRERLDKLKASKGKISEDYQNMLLKLRNAKTAQERADAYAEYMNTIGNTKQQNADTKTKDTDADNKREDDVSAAKIEELKARTKKAEEEAAILRQRLRNMQNGLTPDGKPTTPSSRGGGSGSGGTKKPSQGTKTPKPPTIAEEVVRIAGQDPQGWQAAKEAVRKNTGNRKPSDAQVIAQYNRMHSGGGGSGGSGGGQKNRKKINGFGPQK